MINVLVSAVFTAALLPGASHSQSINAVLWSPVFSQIRAADPKAKSNTKENGSDDLFAGTEKFAQGASESTEVNLDPDDMGMVGSHRSDELAHKVKSMAIRSYKYDKPGMYKMEDVEVYRKKLEDGSWKCSVRVREKNESTDICSRLGPDHETRDLVILTTEPRGVTFIHMRGQMSMEDFAKAGGAIGRAGGAMGKADGAVGKAEGTVGKADGNLNAH